MATFVSFMVEFILCFVAAFGDSEYYGVVIETRCSDGECCVNCNDVRFEYATFDGICQSNGLYSETHECEDNMYYTMNRWGNTLCQGDPIYTIVTGQCYQLLESDEGSCYYECRMQNGVILGSEQEKYVGSNNQNVLIVAIAALLVFVIGSLGGYLIDGHRRKLSQQTHISLL